MKRAPDIVPRYGPQRPFPLSAYRPGQGPHPSTLPEPKWQLDPWDGSENDLLRNQEFRWGVDLYNHRYYWEAHEVWEGLWKVAGAESQVRPFLQGLIQCAGASLKACQGQATGSLRLREKGLARLARVTSETLVDGADLLTFVERFADLAPETIASGVSPIITLETTQR